MHTTLCTLGLSYDPAVYADRLSHRHQATGLRAQAERIDRDAFELGSQALITGLAAFPDAPKP